MERESDSMAPEGPRRVRAAAQYLEWNGVLKKLSITFVGWLWRRNSQRRPA